MKPRHDSWDCHRTAAPERPPFPPFFLGLIGSPMAVLLVVFGKEEETDEHPLGQGSGHWARGVAHIVD